MLEKVKKYVAEWGMLREKDKVVVGVSGGADSVCLLFVLIELRKQIPFEIIAVHVNHELRGEAAKRDEEYVKTLCNTLGIVCETYSENVELIAKNRKQSTEEAGRTVRYEKFQQVMERYGGTRIALAHHKNDNVGTLIMNLARGAGLKGLGGIRPVSGEIIRPLLCVKRSEIEKYLEEQQISYCTDATNESDDYTRNRIRNHVIPYLEENVNAGAVNHLDETMQQMREIHAYLQEQMCLAYDECVQEKEGIYIIKETCWNNVPKVLQSMVVKEVLVRVSGKEKNITLGHVNDISALFQKQTGRVLHLPYEMEAKRCYEGVSISKRQEKKLEMPEVEIQLQIGEMQEYSWKNQKIRLALLEHYEGEKSHSQKGSVQRFYYDIINKGACIRTRKQGDYITIHPDGRTQKLKSFFINEKIPTELRDEILLIADGSHILWIVGYRTNCMYQVHEHTKCVLEIQIDKGE